ncbi:condensation domain-containing protein [Streptomyces sp. PmtG]
MTEREREFMELPASAAQRGLWLIEQLGEPSATYTMHPAVRVDGAFDPDLARRAFEELVRRHETLRTTFSWSEGELTQLVEDIGPEDPVTLDFEVVAAGRDELVARAEELARVPFDVMRGPLLRVRILRAGEREHLVLLVVVHHMVFDGWSEAVLWREFGELYTAEAEGRPAGLPELPLQYGDFADWQRARLDGGVQEELAAYWRGRLDGAGVLDLPTDRTRPAVQGHRGREHRFTVPAAVTAALREFARAEHTTLFSTVYAAYHALLARHTRSDDVCVGVPLGNRALPQLEGVIGLFVNHAVFRIDSGDDPAFRDLVARVRGEFLDAVDRIELPFSRLVEELAPERDLSRNPLFQTVFSLEERPTAQAALPAALLTHVDLHLGISKFDVALVLYDEGEELSGFLEYDSDLFDPAVTAALAEQYVRLLDVASRAPGTRLSALDPVPPDERERHLTAWNDTARDFPRDATTAALFEEQVRAAPDAPAVLTADTTVSYRVLDARAERLARHLRGLGVGPETPVGVCLERSVDLLVAVLGTLKAGGAYLPLPPALPADRLTFCLRDAGAGAVLTTTDLADRFAGADVPVVRVDGGLPDAPGGPLPPPAPGDAENLAYVIYTSGSTGVPKGIGVSHRALARHGQGRRLRRPRARRGPSEPVAAVLRRLAHRSVGPAPERRRCGPSAARPALPGRPARRPQAPPRHQPAADLAPTAPGGRRIPRRAQRRTTAPGRRRRALAAPRPHPASAPAGRTVHARVRAHRVDAVRHRRAAHRRRPAAGHRAHRPPHRQHPRLRHGRALPPAARRRPRASCGSAVTGSPAATTAGPP